MHVEHPAQEKRTPIPVRPDAKMAEGVQKLHELSKLPKADIIRRCCRFALPKFLSGEVSLVSLEADAEKPSTTEVRS